MDTKLVMSNFKFPITSKKKRLVVLPLIVLFSVLFMAPVFAQPAPQITLEPDKESVIAGEELLVTVSVEAGEGNKTNSYIASLSYPEEKLEFDSINTDNSPFKMALQADGGNGKVKIIRGSTAPLEGKLLAATVKFKGKAQVSASEVTVENDSAIIRTSDNTNILPGSTVQNQPGPAASDQSAMEVASQSGGIAGFFEMVKNFFLNLFK